MKVNNRIFLDLSKTSDVQKDILRDMYVNWKDNDPISQRYAAEITNKDMQQLVKLELVRTDEDEKVEEIKRNSVIYGYAEAEVIYTLTDRGKIAAFILSMISEQNANNIK